MKRQWPSFVDLVPEDKSLCGENVDKGWRAYLEKKLPPQYLDLIAPLICDNHEPIHYIIYTEPDKFHSECKHCGAEIKPERWVLK